MPHYKYLILGGGMTADAAAHGIREIDQAGSIGVLSSEPSAPYNRPPLSKGLWKGGKLEEVWRNTEALSGLTLHLQTAAVHLDSAQQFVVDDRQTKYTYEKLLIAIGGTPRHLPSDNDSIIYFRTLGDYQKLRTLTERGTRFAVIGGGFIGSEIAAALRMNQKEVVMAFLEDGVCARVFPSDLANFVTTFYRQKGVEVMPHKTVEAVEAAQGRLRLHLSGMNQMEVDGVVAGLGIVANTELAASAGLQVSDGIVVDKLLRTSSKDIYAAGDVAAFHNPSLGKRLRVEHEDNANTMGRMAGRNMAGAVEHYDHLPSFYSDLFELGYEAVGELDPRLQTISKWKEQFQQGVVYYLEQSRIRGVLLWNVWEKVDAARAAINSGRAFTTAELESLIPVQ